MGCCTSFYEQAEVRELMGDSFHPGGLALSRRTIADLELPAGARILDVACGRGVTTVALAEQHDAVGIDLGPSNLETAREAAKAAGVRAEFVLGDANALPFERASFDAVVCECALSTFEDPSAVLAEFARVTRPGGRLGISDMAVYGALPPRVAELAGPWACLGGASTVEAMQRRLLDAGYRIGACHDESESLQALALTLKRKLVVVGLGRVSGLLGVEVDLPALRAAIEDARDSVRRGDVQYFRLSASLGVPVTAPTPTAASTGCDPSTGCC